MLKTFLAIANLLVCLGILYFVIDLKVSEGGLNLPQGMPQLKKQESLVPHKGIQVDDAESSYNKKNMLYEANNKLEDEAKYD